VHAADPEVTETIKRRDRSYFVLQGNICALLAAKDHVNVFFYDGAIALTHHVQRYQPSSHTRVTGAVSAPPSSCSGLPTASPASER
jgi:hypothetical protein